MLSAWIMPQSTLRPYFSPFLSLLVVMGSWRPGPPSWDLWWWCHWMLVWVKCSSIPAPGKAAREHGHGWLLLDPEPLSSQWNIFTFSPFRRIILIDSDCMPIFTFLLKELMVFFGISRCPWDYRFFLLCCCFLPLNGIFLQWNYRRHTDQGNVCFRTFSLPRWTQWQLPKVTYRSKLPREKSPKHFCLVT